MTNPVQSEAERILSYLQQQAAQRSIDELISRVQEGVDDLAAAARALNPATLDTPSGESETPGEPWSPRQCLEHAAGSNISVARNVLHVALSGEFPAPEAVKLPADVETVLAQHAEAIESLYAHVREADPGGFPDVKWRHPMFGDLNWREWLLFIRIHSKDHASQLAAMTAPPGS